jgi:hypothetical protein
MVYVSLSQYDPLSTFPATFRTFEDALARMLNEPRGTRPWPPSVDIYETSNAATAPSSAVSQYLQRSTPKR